MLDASIRDEAFLTKAKGSLGLTDLEVDKLRANIDTAMSDLDEGDSSDRSTKQSEQKATEIVEKNLGAERGRRLIGLVQQEWSSEDQTALTNDVPTDTRVVVNIPAFRMDIFDKGKLVKSYKIGVGYPEFPLPTGRRKAKQIIINPTWTPPDEAWVKGKVRPHEKVEAGDKLNPLGPIKIPLGGPSLIHGGKSPARLGTFASHGCVGLTDPQVEDFAVRISSIAGKPLTLEEIKGFEKAKTETKTFDLAQDMPVELRYATIVVEDGTLKIYRDVYERGTNTEENLRSVLEANGSSLDQLDEATRTKVLQALKDMGTDASGAPVDIDQPANANASDKKVNSKTDATITRNIKGKKVVEFKIPALAGKGYPAPVGEKF